MKVIQESVTKAVENYFNSDNLEKLIQDKVNSSISEIISDMFSYRGDVKKALEEGLKFQLEDMQFQTYNQQMISAIKTASDQFIINEASKQLQEEVIKVFDPAPKEVTMNVLVDTLLMYMREDLDTDENWYDDYATISLEQKDWSSDEDPSYSLNISIPKKGYSRQEEVELFISSGNIRINHKMTFNPTCLSAIEKYIFVLYSAKTLITNIKDFDEDDCNTQLWED